MRSVRGAGLLLGCIAALGCGEPGPVGSFFEHADASIANPSVADSGSGATDDARPCPLFIQEFAVIVTDKRTARTICDATVTAQGPMSVSFQVEGSEASCSYLQVPGSIAGGSYTVDVTAPGYQPAQQANLIVNVDACGYSAPTVTIALEPDATTADASVDQSAADTGSDGPFDTPGAD